MNVDFRGPKRLGHAAPLLEAPTIFVARQAAPDSTVRVRDVRDSVPASHAGSVGNVIAMRAAIIEQAQHGKRPESDARGFFRDLSGAIARVTPQIVATLAEVNNIHGSRYELEQVKRTIDKLDVQEGHWLRGLGDVNNVAVYASTNVPFYSLLLHGIIPASAGAHVWLRTPARTRGVYAKLYDILVEAMPGWDLSRLHVLTSDRDVQYDYFRKLHVLGLNAKGKQPVRPPSEVVLFTGSPVTAARIRDEVQAKLEKLDSPADTRMLFLSFGVGLNPVIVSDTAESRIDAATDAIVEAVRINSSQDCIVPKLVMVHASQAERYFASLEAKLAGLRYGDAADPTADYTALTMTEDLDVLHNYRDTYADKLVNPAAVLDPASKRVDPHVFRFTMKDFADLPLVEFFAPMFPHVVYESDDDLRRVAADPRVAEKAMFATVFADPTSPRIFTTRKIFDDTLHGTLVNQSIFKEESGNHPFGGYGPHASTRALISKTAGEVTSTIAHRPLLYSQEAARVFAPAGSTPYASTPPTAADEQRLSAVLAEAADAQLAFDISGMQFAPLKQPFTGSRPRGLAELRKVIAEQGLRVYVPIADPGTAEGRKRDELFYGGRVIYAHASPSMRLEPGVVLHPSKVGADVDNLNRVRGAVNPHLGYGYLHGIFTSKAKELALVRGVDASMMPETLFGAELFTNSSESAARFTAARRDITEALAAVAKGKAAVDELAPRLRALIDDFFAMVEHQMPAGAYVKNFREFATADLGNAITSFSFSRDQWVQQYVDRLRDVIAASPGVASDSGAFREALFAKRYDTGTKFLHSLVHDPDVLIVQQRVRFAKTPLGLPREVRVSFIDGEAVYARPRHTNEPLGADIERAKQVITDFFARAPEQLRYLAGGADVAFLEDGRPMILEFNMGANDGTILAEDFPVECNRFMSALQGRPTVLIEQLEAAYEAGPEACRAYLGGLTNHFEQWTKASWDDVSIPEVAKWFRDRRLQDVSATPTAGEVVSAIADIEAMTQGLVSSENRELAMLLHGTKLHLNERLER